MSRQRRTRHILRALAAPLATAALLITPGVANAAGGLAAACRSWTTAPPPSPGTLNNQFQGVTALSPCDVWAVGGYGNMGSSQGLSLAEHWNGTAWKVLPTPSPGSSVNFLLAASAGSASNVWSVGNTSDGPAARTLILHWNGDAWKQVASPSPGTAGNALNGVAAVSATSSAWAVGSYSNGGQQKTLILHWNGRKWAKVPSPAPNGGSTLNAVTATSARDAWAVGETFGGTTLVLHWNGQKWTRVASPNPAGPLTEVNVTGVAATSAGNAWAVGDFHTGTGGAGTLALHWNGRSWKLVPSPSPGSEPVLLGVAAASAANAWAVGSYRAGSAVKTLIIHWNGAAWKQVASPSAADGSTLAAVTARSAGNVWAVGQFRDSPGTPTQVLALHCC